MPIKEESFTIKELDSLVMTIELTLVSIVQGVALAVLAESSVAIVTGMKLAYFPYVASGLIVILLFWSRALLHTLTVIRWPLEFSHNFLYIACTLIEAILFTQVDSPLHWFALTVAYSLSIWLLFAVDLRMIDRRFAQHNLPGIRSLLESVRREQHFNIRFVIPATVVLSALCAWLTWRFPDLFIARQAHVVLGSMQLVVAMSYLVYSIAFYKRLRSLIVAAQYEWNGEVMPATQRHN
jgi:hypothetical protein